MRRKHRIKPLLSRALLVLGVVAAIIMIQVVLQGLGGKSHPVGDWAVQKLEKIFTPISRWFVETSDWAWISFVCVVNIPAAMLLTWALHVGGLGIRPKYRPYWFALWWVVLVAGQMLVIYWARQRPGI
jgi:hypothetical protein